MAYGGRSTYWLNQPTTSHTWTVKCCRFCKAGGKSEATYTSHDSVYCDSLSRSELRAMLAALQAMDLVPNNGEYDDDAGTYKNYQGDQSQGLEPAGSS